MGRRVLETSLKDDLDARMLWGIPISLNSQVVPVRTKIVLDIKLKDFHAILIKDVPTELTPRVRYIQIVESSIWRPVCLAVSDIDD
jgi:hypothetical protein